MSDKGNKTEAAKHSGDIEENLEEIKKDFFFFLENTPDFIYFKDKIHRFTYTSNAFAKLTGHDNWQALIGKNDFDIFP